MHFVAIKSVEQQAVLMVHRARTLVMANRTAQVNQIRGLMGEFGIVRSQGGGAIAVRAAGDSRRCGETAYPHSRARSSPHCSSSSTSLNTRVTAYDRQIRALAASQ